MLKTRFLPAAALALAGGWLGLASLSGAHAEAPAAGTVAGTVAGTAPGIGRYEITTVPLEPGLVLRSATFTPAGKILVNFARSETQDRRQIELATMDADGRNMRTFFSAAVPPRPKDNGLRFMIFPDNKRIFMGDFVLECATALETCSNPQLVPVSYPREVADGPHVMHRWSEMIVAPDNRHVAWTTLFNNATGAAFTAELRREPSGYVMAAPRIISTLDPFLPDPKHPDGVIPQPLRGGEVKQFVHGGTAISAVGSGRRDTPDSTVLHLATGQVERITDTPGYTETTIFSPDERLGVTMTTRFSQSDPAILGLMPRPHPGALNIGLAWAAYTYGVTGVRQGRPGSIGPALIEIGKSKTQPGYQGVNLNTSEDWVFNSPLSWHPDGTKALWPESRRGDRGASRRIQMVRLLDYKPARPVPVRATPHGTAAHSVADLSVLEKYTAPTRQIDAKVYGAVSGYIQYRRSPEGEIRKTYVNFSDGGGQVYSGEETMHANPRGRSTYTADVRLTGPQPGTMALKITFGPLSGPRPAEILFAPGDDGKPLTHGFVEYGGRRIDAATMVP